jgi:hypothetical protein
MVKIHYNIILIHYERIIVESLIPAGLISRTLS